MSKILRVALPIALIVMVYTREPMGTLFGYNAFSLIPLPIWLLLLVTLGGANAASAFVLVRTESARHLAFWGLTLKVCFLPIFLVNLFVVVVMTGQELSFTPAALVLGLALIIPYTVLSFVLMIVSSCYGLAATIRARNEHLISPETAKKYMHGHAIPIDDLVSSIRLYLLLRRLDGAAPTNAQDTNQLSRTLIVAQPVPLIDNTVTTRAPRASRIPWPTVVSLAASFCFVVTAYAGGPFTMAFPSPPPDAPNRRLAVRDACLRHGDCRLHALLPQHAHAPRTDVLGPRHQTLFPPFLPSYILDNPFPRTVYGRPRRPRPSGIHPLPCIPGELHHHDRHLDPRIRSDRPCARRATDLP